MKAGDVRLVMVDVGGDFNLCRARHWPSDPTAAPQDAAAQNTLSSLLRGRNSARGHRASTKMAPAEPRTGTRMAPADQLNLRWLIAIGAIMVQPFLTATSLDLSAKICVIAFAAAIPLLAALVVVNHQEAFRGRRSKSRIVNIA